MQYCKKSSVLHIIQLLMQGKTWLDKYTAWTHLIGITKTICRNTGIVDDNIILHQSKHSMTCVHVHYSFLRFKNLF